MNAAGADAPPGPARPAITSPMDPEARDDIGVSNVGLKILYDLVNQREDSLAERAYAPWLEMESLMRENGIPLYALESKRPLACFDLIGFTLPYETLYTNTLNILDLAGIPVRSADRDETHPIVIAGGHAATNPDPMHAFIDAFAIGEAEEVIHDIIGVLQKTKGPKRTETLRGLAGIQGVYVPGFYEAHYFEDGTVSHIDSLIPEARVFAPLRQISVLYRT